MMSLGITPQQPPQVLPELMEGVGLSTKPTVVSRFEQLMSLAWSRNGHNLSRMYTGTDALHGLEGKTKVARQ